ncbi:hypothetical protein RHSIM_Rhsim01G0057000 [Rhododendron simsii]|uniref:H(+)-exporting diphosphatase n=1 Tax=Rhododendron simsii TaxID=118357 RepID=A0A834HJ94_RHOSS|nr:hypothetical protein RHSIM_Rhsim01G0057000 [Rhododendron simsii]
MLSFPSSLVFLAIRKFPDLEKLSFKDFENLVSLEKLHIRSCPELTSISELGRLPSLLDLVISGCPNLALFPEQGLPPSLLYLSIDECPMLKRRCENGKGKYWGFIAHIPEVMIDKKEVEVFNPAKAADVGADIIDKVERNIPDDDPRIERYDAICFRFCFKKSPTNVIAYSVGKIAGMGYDLIGLYVESTCAARVFGSISSFGINHNWNVLSFAH